jgi:hypothetical protein
MDLRLSSLHRLRDRHPLAVGFIVRWFVAEIDVGNAGVPPNIVNVRHGETAGLIRPDAVMLAVQRIVDIEFLATHNPNQILEVFCLCNNARCGEFGQKDPPPIFLANFLEYLGTTLLAI